MTVGPILTAIEDGHYSRTSEKGQPTLCGQCKMPWPCPTMREARKEQPKYAENLRLSRITSAENRKTYLW